MGNQKRNPRTYKVTDDFYTKAKERAEKENGHISTLIENVIICYASELEIKAVKSEVNGATALDVFSLSHSDVISSVKSNRK